MENFRQQFLLESAAALEIILQNLQNAKFISESSRRETFRTLHTIKGTAQTFGFSLSSRLAHQLEDLLAANENSDDLFLEGVELLIKSLKEKDFEIPQSFQTKIGGIVLDSTSANNQFETFSGIVPDEFTAQLSNQEKAYLNSALQVGKNLFCFEIDFELANFADELINFREILNDSGEIIATLPSGALSGDDKIGFQILFASVEPVSEIELVAATNRAKVIFNFSPAGFSSDLRSILTEAAGHGRETAKKLSKQIEFVTVADEITISARELRIVFDVLLHLVRNAVDHAIDTTGKIEINAKSENGGLRLVVSDDGRGIDLEKIKAKAIEKNLLLADQNLTEQEMLNLIFLPEFSTKSTVTEISGRGVGLDAVKFAIEEAGGRITVVSQAGKGSRFEVFLPTEQTGESGNLTK